MLYEMELFNRVRKLALLYDLWYCFNAHASHLISWQQQKLPLYNHNYNHKYIAMRLNFIHKAIFIIHVKYCEKREKS